MHDGESNGNVNTELLEQGVDDHDAEGLLDEECADDIRAPIDHFVALTDRIWMGEGRACNHHYQGDRACNHHYCFCCCCQ